MNLDQYNPQDAPLTAEEQLQHDLRAAAINTPPPLPDAPQQEMQNDLQGVADNPAESGGGSFETSGELGDGGGEFDTSGGMGADRFMGRAMTNREVEGNPSANPIVPQGHWGKRQPTDAGGMVRPWEAGPATLQSQPQSQVATQDVMGNNVWEPANGFAATPAQDHVAHFHQHGGTPAAYEWDQAQRDRKAQQMGLAYDASHLSPAENDEITREAGMKFNNIPPGHHKQAAMARFINEATAARLRFKKDALHQVTAQQNAVRDAKIKMQHDMNIAERQLKAQEAASAKQDKGIEAKERHAEQEHQWKAADAAEKVKEREHAREVRRIEREQLSGKNAADSYRHHLAELEKARTKFLEGKDEDKLPDYLKDEAAMKAKARERVKEEMSLADEVRAAKEGKAADVPAAKPPNPAAEAAVADAIRAAQERARQAQQQPPALTPPGIGIPKLGTPGFYPAGTAGI